MRWLGVEITSPGGRTLWAPDNPDPRRVPIDLEFGSVVPGGFADCTIRVSRRVTDDLPDVEPLSNVRIVGPAGETVWEGRVHEAPVDSSAPALELRCVGWSAALEDNPRAVTTLYVTSQLDGFVDPPIERRAQYATTQYAFRSASRTTGSDGTQWLVLEHEPPWGNPPQRVVAARFDAGAGAKIKRVWYAREVSNVDLADSLWIIEGQAWDIASGSWQQFDTFNLRTAAASGALTFTTGRRAFELYQRYAAASSAGGPYQTRWRVTLYGDHGLPLYGASEPKGVLASDVIKHAVATGSESIVTTSTSVVATDFPILELDFTDGATVKEVIERVNAYHLWAWAVWENRVLYYRPPQASTVWQVALEDGAEAALEGDDVSDVINGVVVRYQGSDGRTRVAGPPGSRSDVESAALQDTSSANPVNAAGAGRRWAVLDLSRAASDIAAVQLGAVYLREKSTPKRSGVIRVTGDVMQGASRVPGWQVRAGDWVEIREAPGLRWISQARWSHRDQRLELQVGAGIGTVEAILARVGAAVAEVVG